MRVAIDRGFMASGDNLRGIGFHTRELVRELEKLKDSDFDLDVVDFTSVDLSKYDIVHYQSFNPYRTHLPFLKPAKRVVLTIHDLIYLIYPNAYPPGIRGKINFWLQKINLRNVDAIITISETSKKDIVRFLGIAPEKIFVTYLAPQTEAPKENTHKFRQKFPDKFVLYIGDVNYNKNLMNLAIACKLSKLKLVIVGKQAVDNNVDDHIENRSWKKFLEKFEKDEDIVRVGFVENLDDVFIGAILYCQPSLYEGFGLPLLEAFERGLPVVASRTQTLVEVGGDACVYFDPKDAKDLAEKLTKVFADKQLQRRLVKKGRERLKHFSWVKCAKETLNVYKKIL